MDYVLEPLLDDDDVILFDIKTGEGYKDWCGSRRTVSACKLFMKEKPILSEIENLPNHDHHVILRRLFLVYGESILPTYPAYLRKPELGNKETVA